MEEVELSEAMTLLTHVWKCSLRVKPFSDRRFSSTMNEALELAIKGRLRFDIEDCANISKTFKVGGGYFIEQIVSFGEGFYIKAIIAKNMSACHTFEHCIGRKPFIVDNVDHPQYDVAGIWDLTRPRDRLGIGSKFLWHGKKVTVTSFDDKNKRIICCAYKSRGRETPCATCGRGGWEVGTLKVENIYKLTRKDLEGSKLKP